MSREWNYSWTTTICSICLTKNKTCYGYGLCVMAMPWQVKNHPRLIMAEHFLCLISPSGHMYGGFFVAPLKMADGQYGALMISSLQRRQQQTPPANSNRWEGLPCFTSVATPAEVCLNDGQLLGGSYIWKYAKYPNGCSDDETEVDGLQTNDASARHSFNKMALKTYIRVGCIC